MSENVLHVDEPRSSSRASMSILGDQALCELVRNDRDSGAYAELYKRHREVAMAQAYKMTGDRSAAEDLVAETFARVFRALSNGKGPKDSVLGYVLISLRSEAIRVAHAEAGVSSVSTDVLAETVGEQEPDFSEALSERDQIGRAFSVLSEDARRVLWLLDVEQTPIDEAAEYLGVTTGAVRVLAHRSRKKLATAYLQQYVEVMRPDCTEVAGLLAEYVRKALGKRANTKVEDHLPTCHHCVTQVTRLGALQRQLRVWAGPMLIGGAAGGLSSVGGDAAASAQVIDTGGRYATLMKAVGWVGLAGGIALLVMGALTLIPGTAPSPLPEPSSGDESISAGVVSEQATQQPAGEAPAPGPSRGGATTEPPTMTDDQLHTEESVPQDDATPNWKLLGR